MSIPVPSWDEDHWVAPRSKSSMPPLPSAMTSGFEQSAGAGASRESSAASGAPGLSLDELPHAVNATKQRVTPALISPFIRAS
jgi:hypothetical protein